jgi:hypothetical protein
MVLDAMSFPSHFLGFVSVSISAILLIDVYVLLSVSAAGVAGWVDGHKQQLAYLSAFFLALVPWVQVGDRRVT